MIALIDYGAGNLTSVRKAFAHLGADVVSVDAPERLNNVRGIVVPGVGNFDRTQGISAPLRDAMQARMKAGVPLLGVCVGLQWLFDGSAEAPGVRGLCTFQGTCVRLDAPKVPHVGWNSLHFPRPSRLMRGLPDGVQVYFTHSYAAPVIEATAAVAEYGAPFSAALERDSVSAVQFHPEKSGNVGLRILQNWLDGL